MGETESASSTTAIQKRVVGRPAHWDWEMFGRGVTAQEAAQHYGWSMGVATEELAMAEEKGAVCREDGVEGTRYWENWIGQDESNRGADSDAAVIARNLEDIGLV